MQSLRSFLPVALLTLATVSACSPVSERECYERPIEKDGPWILLDHYHSRKQNPEQYVLTKDDFNYQGVFGFRRIFNHLERAGYNWSSVREMPLSEERLEGYDVLFVNLVSSDRPDFSEEEVDAIVEFVRRGGGLFVIADHTNVYRHAERVNRFLEPMGVEVLYHIAVDYPPTHSVAGLGWILVWDFVHHPVTKDIDMISLQTGGPLRSDGGGVALTSEESFADLWDPEDQGGYYGNWQFDGDEEAEPKGPLEVVTAVEFGEGRVVVVGDQNIFGDAWTHYGDNFELAMNSFEWLAKHDGEEPLRDFRPVGTLIGMDQTHSDFRMGKPVPNGYWVFYVNSNRDPEITGRGTTRLDHVDDAMLLMNPQTEYSATEVANIRGYLDRGKSIVVTFEPGSVTSATSKLLAELDATFSVKTGDAVATVANDGELEDFAPPRLSGEHLALTSSKLDVAGLSIGSYDADPSETEDPNQFPPYLLDMQSDWGEPFLQATTADGRTIDLARVKQVGDAELIVFVQDGFFRNRTLGEYLRAPLPYNEDAHQVQYRLLDYLKVAEAEPSPDSHDDDPSPTRVCP